jgi:glutamate-1-semialdehyde 2,1-aminomutase
MHPWAGKVRFARTGGEAAAIAVRIARAATGKDQVAICGYHGWHDWYLSANLSDSQNLNSHLMRNLPIEGVQKNLKNSALFLNIIILIS